MRKHLRSLTTYVREKPDGTALTLNAIKDFMQGQTAITLRRQGNGAASAAGPPPADVLYRRGRPALQLTLVLSGKVRSYGLIESCAGNKCTALGSVALTFF